MRPISVVFFCYLFAHSIVRMPISRLNKFRPAAEKTAIRHARKSGRKHEKWDIYSYRVLKHMHPDLGISKKAMGITNSFLNDVYERVTGLSAHLCKLNDEKTMTHRHIITAVKLLIPGELGKRAVVEGTMAVNKFLASSNKGMCFI